MSALDKTYAIFDLDGTLTQRDTYLNYLVSYFMQHPSSWIKGIPLGIYALLYALKIKDNTWLKQRFLSTLLSGKSRSQLSAWNQQFVEKTLNKNMRDKAKGAIYLHQQSGHECILLSASLDLYVPLLGETLGFEQVICTQVEWKNDILTGQLLGENHKGAQKIVAWENFTATLPNNSFSTIAYGDHSSDLLWLQYVDHGVLISDKPNLVAQAKALKLEVQQW